MDKKKLRKPLILLIFFILIANFLANKFYWYSSIWYFDMIMHFLGGFWIGLMYSSFPIKDSSIFRTVFKILFFVLFVGVGWEIFEILVNEVVSKNPFDALDTFSDIFFDLAGGSVAILYYLKK